jgi:hypothetical protein
MCLEDVMQFLTGKRIIAPGDKSVIQVLVIKATEDEFGRPAVSTCAQKFTTKSIRLCEMCGLRQWHSLLSVSHLIKRLEIALHVSIHRHKCLILF